MQNLLPQIKRSVACHSEDKLSSWHPADAIASKKELSYALRSEISAPRVEELMLYAENVLPMPEPNVRHTHKQLSSSSPLRKAERGIADRPRLEFTSPPSLTKKYTISVERPEKLVAHVTNTLPLCLDLFVQRLKTMSSSTVYPNRHVSRVVTQEEAEGEPIKIWFANAPRAILNFTSRQELRLFTFVPHQQIGLEIELSEGRLSITDVIPDCQASPYEKVLRGAGVVSINGSRVITMEEFSQALSAAQDTGQIELQVACFIGGQNATDRLFLFDFSKRGGAVQSLMSNIMMNGFDSEHQRGLDVSSSKSSRSSSRSSTSSSSSRSSSRTSGGSLVTPPKQEQGDEDKGDLVFSVSAGEGGEVPMLIPGPQGLHGWDHLVQPDVPIDNPEELQAAKRDAYSDSGDEDDFDDNSVSSEDSGGGGAPIGSGKSGVSVGEASVGSVGSVGSYGSWNKLTKIDDDEIHSAQCLVCTPTNMSPSPWGEARKTMQISNFGSWSLEVYWSDEKGIMKKMGELKRGQSMYQACGEDQLWSVVATSTLEAPESEIMRGLCSLKLSRSALITGRCCSVMWTPLSGMTITQRVYPATKAKVVSVEKEAARSPSIQLAPKMLNLPPLVRSASMAEAYSKVLAEAASPDRQMPSRFHDMVGKYYSLHASPKKVKSLASSASGSLAIIRAEMEAMEALKPHFHPTPHLHLQIFDGINKGQPNVGGTGGTEALGRLKLVAKRKPPKQIFSPKRGGT